MGGGLCGEGEGLSAAVQSNRAVVELVKKRESNSCGQFDRRLARPFSRPTKTTEKKTPASRPPAWGACARSVRRVPTSVVPPTRAGATPWALASPSLTPSPSASPRRGDLARCSSTQVALEPFRRGAGSGGVFRCGSAPPSRRPSWDFHPRTRGGLPRNLSQVRPKCFPLGRGSRLSGGGSSAFSLSRFAPCADSQRARARRGDLCRQNGRGSQGWKLISPEFCRARFPPCGGRLALKSRDGQTRASQTGASAGVSPRAAYATLRLFSRQ